MKKIKKLSKLQQLKVEIKNLKWRLESRENQTNAYKEQLEEARKLSPRLIRVKQFSIYELQNPESHFTDWHKANPYIEIVKMEFVEKPGQLEKTLFVFYK